MASPSQTRWLLFNAGQPLTTSRDDGSARQSPIYLTTEDPFFGQGKEQGQLVVGEGQRTHDHGQHSPTESARHLGLRVVFLGLHEKQSGHNSTALPSSELSDPEQAIKKLEGTPYFSVDVGKILSWAEPRSLMSTLNAVTAGIFASARSLVDWNQRNKFCAGCGSPTYSMWGGWKIACTSLLPWADNSNRKPCPTVKGLHNFTHPRTDAVVIMIAIDETGDQVLLGRGRRFPGKFYSALAGFIEPGESFEDAVAREMWEEAGVHVWNVKYHSGQPWPYPANLMVGFYARADSTKPIRTDLDNELVDARWFTREEVEAVLNNSAGTRFGKADYKKMAEIADGPSNTDQKPTLEPAARALAPADPRTIMTPAKSPDATSDDEPAFRLPPLTAIAGVLIRDWVDRKIGFSLEDAKPEETIKKGNL
ncbi:NUDIX hydrolase domain-like protein [Flammula alnicola]|nr:NUDIX hydrolase domain-like protein [Flammula alnicola]